MDAAQVSEAQHYLHLAPGRLLPSPERGHLSWFSRYGREGLSGMEKPFPCESTFPLNPCHLGAMLFSKLCQFRDLPQGMGA